MSGGRRRLSQSAGRAQWQRLLIGAVALLMLPVGCSVRSGIGTDPGREPLATLVPVSGLGPALVSRAVNARRQVDRSLSAIRSPLGAPPPGLVPPTGATPDARARQPSAAGGCGRAGHLGSWPTTRLAAQVLSTPVEMADLSRATRDVRAGVGALLLFGPSAPTDLGARLRQLRSAAPTGIAPLVLADEEGGAVQRLQGVVGTVPSARAMGSMSPARVRALAATIGRRMLAAGVTVDLAPVLDLDDGPGPSAADPDGTRSFGTDPAAVSARADAFAAGLRAAGVLPVVKHFPGLGHASGNTDNMPARTVPWSQLRTAGLQPFRVAVASGVPAVMVANAGVPGLTSLPASISPLVIGTVLRRQLHFDGLVVTDSLSAEALRQAGYPPPQAAVAALRAGADLILLGDGGTEDPVVAAQATSAIARALAAGSLTRARLVDAAAHVLSAKRVRFCR